MVELLTVCAGDPAYAELLDPVRADRALMARIWADSESTMPEESGKVWCVAAVWAGGHRHAGAWCAAYETVDDGEPTLKCCDSYELLRGRGLYAAVYAHRHREVVLPAATRGLPALTYVFAQPLPLHLADGWHVTDEGDSAEPGIEPHRWYELRRPAGV